MTDTVPPTLPVPVPANETERLAALHGYKILDTPPEVAFDRITRMAARLFDMPIALISLVDETRAWFKSCIGFGTNEVPRDSTLCSFAVLTDKPLIIPDARKDDRFVCNPFVQAEPGLRFYAGAPLLNQDGFNLGTLCLLDSQPRAAFTPEQEATLVDLAAMVVDELELRLAARKVAQVDAALLEITQGVASVTGEAFFDALVRYFAKVLGTQYAYIGVIEGDDPQRIRTIATFAGSQIVENLDYPLQDTPCWEVIQQRKTCCYPRNVQAYFPHAPLLKPLAVESYAATPFFDSNGQAIGLVGIMDGKPLENVYLVQSLLTVFAGRIATELGRQQAEAAIQASNEQFKLLAESASNLLLIEDPKVYLATLFEKLSAQLQLEIYVSYFFQEDQQRLELYTYGGLPQEVAAAARYLELGQPVCGHAVQRRCPVVLENALEDTGPLAVPLRSLGIRAYATHPLIVGDRVMGTLGLGTYQRDRFKPGELELMEAVTAQVAAALERSRLLTELQVRAEALTQANRLKDEFLAVLSHELRSPLNPILGWTKLLQGGKLDPARQTEALKTIERNAKLQAQLVEDLLDISRIMQGKLSLTVAAVSLKSVIVAAIETVRLAAEAKNIRIALNLDALSASVAGDAARLQQVVWNLLTNAVKFTPSGGNVTVQLRQINQFAQIRVMDSGVGISPQFLPYVFEYFRQEDGSITRKFGGLGLGLAIVRQIVEMHGGTVWAESTGENQGAAFTVQFPLSSESSASELEPPSSAAVEAPLSNLHILLVDDEPDTREFEAFVLEQSGARVTAVASGLEALQVLDRLTPDVLISDVGMAEMDGYKLMRQIRHRGQAQNSSHFSEADRTASVQAFPIPKAIALTAYASDFDQQQAFQAGFQKHLTKPIEPQVLIEAIMALVGRTV